MDEADTWARGRDRSGPRVRSDESGTGDEIVVRFWGTRGSIPSPGPRTVIYGGNTACVEILRGGQRWILDAGTGIRKLGSVLVREAESTPITILLTHFHWDHIQGLPFFSPLYKGAFDVRIVGPRQRDAGVEDLLSRQMGPVHFPLDFGEITARLAVEDVEGGEIADAGMHLECMPVRHSSLTLGYRLELGDRRICYVPDNELAGGRYETDPGFRDRFLSFVAGADLLIHDAMFTDAEYPAVEGWGHSTYQQTLDLALEAEVRRVAFFHHAPERSDSDLWENVARLKRGLEEAGRLLQVSAAREGETSVL